MSNVSCAASPAACAFDVASYRLHETADPVAAGNCFLGLRDNAPGASIVAAANDASPVHAPAVLVPAVLAPVVGEHGFFASLYLRLRDWLVDRFPGLDRFLPEGGRSGAEKAMVYAQKVRDTVRAQANAAPGMKRGLVEKRDAYLNIIGNAADRASARCRAVMDRQPGPQCVDAARAEMDSAWRYYDFAASFAQVADEYPQEGAFDSLLPLFADGTVQAPHLVDRSDLPLLAGMAVELGSDGSDGPRRSGVLARTVLEHARSIGHEGSVLEADVRVQMAQLQAVHAAALSDEGEIARLAGDDVPDATALRDLLARHRRNVSNMNGARAKIEASNLATARLHMECGYLERAADILDAAAGGMPRSARRDVAARLADVKEPAPVPQAMRRAVSALERAPTAASLLGQTDSIQPA